MQTLTSIEFARLWASARIREGDVLLFDRRGCGGLDVASAVIRAVQRRLLDDLGLQSLDQLPAMQAGVPQPDLFKALDGDAVPATEPETAAVAAEESGGADAPRTAAVQGTAGLDGQASLLPQV